jgi:hypothetical protein
VKKVRFAGDQQRLPAPGFQVETIAGETISLDDYRNRSNLVLLFANGVEGERLDDTVQAFATRRREYEANDAHVVVMTTSSAPEVESTGPFPRVAADPGGEVRAHYSGLLPEAPQPDDALVFVLDRFATPHVAFVTRDPADPALHAKIVSWLLGIELECPE